MWSFDGKKFSEVDGPVHFNHGERLRLTLWNDTMMDHPIHLHGMFMELENGHELMPRKHTILVKPGEKVSLQITADAPGDWNRIWLEAEGEHDLHGSGRGEIERFDILGSHLIAPFWEVRGGLGLQAYYGPGSNNQRGFAVIGIQGLAPYRFETDANLRVSDDGDVSADLETAIAFSDVPEFEKGSGINNIKTGLRLRYEIEREFAPYIGVSWDRKLGETEDIIKRDGGDTSNVSVLLGVRAWF